MFDLKEVAYIKDDNCFPITFLSKEHHNPVERFYNRLSVYVLEEDELDVPNSPILINVTDDFKKKSALWVYEGVLDCESIDGFEFLNALTTNPVDMRAVKFYNRSENSISVDVFNAIKSEDFHIYLKSESKLSATTNGDKVTWSSFANKKYDWFTCEKLYIGRCFAGVGFMGAQYTDAFCTMERNSDNELITTTYLCLDKDIVYSVIPLGMTNDVYGMYHTLSKVISSKIIGLTDTSIEVMFDGKHIVAANYNYVIHMFTLTCLETHKSDTLINYSAENIDKVLTNLVECE